MKFKKHINNYIYIKINNFDENLLLKFQKDQIEISKIEYYKNYAILKVKDADYEKLKAKNKFLNIDIYKYTGVRKIKNLYKKYKFLFYGLIIGIIFINISNLFIVDIEIKHEDAELVNLLINELDKYGITKFSIKKKYNEIQKIKNKIKNDHLDKIDWIEIKKQGMKYIVMVEERIKNEKNQPPIYCNVYASKDGLIKKVKLLSGTSNVEMNDYVTKGDLLISGDIMLNDKVVNQTCASAKVYAEVWYTVNLKIPLEYQEKEKTGKVRNNLIVNFKNIDYQIFKNRLKDFETEKEKIFDLMGVEIFLKKEIEIKKKNKKYTPEQAVKIAEKKAREKILINLNKDDKIIEQKILQKYLNDSIMYVEIFIVAQEDIALQTAM